MSAQGGKFDLTRGGILQKLIMVALPIMGTQFIQMAYNLTDMFWLGRLGGEAVAATGASGMYLWLSMAFFLFGRMGAEIGVSQNLGRGDKASAKGYAQTANTLSLLLGLLIGALYMLLRTPLIGFFHIQEPSVAFDAERYLLIVSAGIPFTFFSASVTGIFNGSGNSRVPFLVNSTGLVLNMTLDPLLIYGFDWGVAGAAIATVAAQAVVSVLFLLTLLFHRHRPFERFRLFRVPDGKNLLQIAKWVTPAAIESFLFTFFAMIISRAVAGHGSEALAAQRVGSQAESLSWLIAGGFSSAVMAFVGQNFGAEKWSRIRRGFKLSVYAMLIWGVVITGILFFGARSIFLLFLPDDPGSVAIGTDYLRILAFCQLSACLEAVSSGVFRGLGKTLPPSLVSVTINALRAGVVFFAADTLGLDGIWWAVSLGAFARGVWIFLWYLTANRRLPREDAALSSVSAQNE